jgi:uncharacterized repeat protein (TIGR03803 family)
MGIRAQEIGNTNESSRLVRKYQEKFETPLKLSGGSVNHVRRQDKPFRMVATFMLAMLVLTLAETAIPAQAQTYRVVYTFGTNSATDPIIPGGGPDFIAQGRDGNLYSTSQAGGTDNRGAAFKITPSGTETVLASFVFTNGLIPLGGLTLGTDGNLYGTSQQGGDSNCNLGFGCGTVFKITPGGVLTTLFIFPADLSKGYYPFAAPTQGTDGNFYGTTEGNTGTVFKITPTGMLTTLHTFNGTDGSFVESGLIQGTDGSFYGGSFGGGANGDGVVFKITPSGVFSVLHNFTGSDGSSSWSLIQAADGNFYGATVAGGTSNAGVVFKITPNGTYSVLYNLNGTTDGLNAYSSLVQATDGNFYGVTDMGGTLGYGTIYKSTPQGAYSVVHNFDDTNGANPWSTLTQNTNGILYGDTFKGGKLTICGTPGCGVVYSLDMGLKPFVRLVSTSGKEGVKIGILGQGFSSSSVVEFGGVLATSIKRAGKTFISATVPAGALTGPVTVTTGSKILTSAQTFRVRPTILSFNPTSGSVGTPVMITGTGLMQTTKVTFGGVKATTFTANSDTQVTADVPTGAVTGKIGITTKGGSAKSKTDFTVN